MQEKPLGCSKKIPVSTLLVSKKQEEFKIEYWYLTYRSCWVPLNLWRCHKSHSQGGDEASHCGSFPFWTPSKCSNIADCKCLIKGRRYYLVVVVVQLPSHVQLFATTWTAAHQASLSLTISQSLPKFMFIALVMLSNHLILWYPLFLLPLIFPSTRDFSNESSVCIKWPKYWSFSFDISPSIRLFRVDLP